MTQGLPYVLARKAETDFDEIWHYIAMHNFDAADRLLETLRKTFRLLGNNPSLGEIFDSRRPFLRRFIHENYVVYYDATTGPITIVRLLHGARDTTGLI